VEVFHRAADGRQYPFAKRNRKMWEIVQRFGGTVLLRFVRFFGVVIWIAPRIGRRRRATKQTSPLPVLHFVKCTAKCG